MTLYLKYRPQSLGSVVGQDPIVTTLRQAIERDQLAHAYLFCGTRGTGKTSVARILAKTLLLKGTEDAVLRTQIEQGVENGSLVDFVEIDAASNRRIDDIRELIDKIQFSPLIAKTKVYIIDEVHMLTKEAFNALLKTLEEPPSYAFFILATTELHKVPDTIQSRCQRFLFKRVKPEDLVSRLRYIATEEKIEVTDEALSTIAFHASGSFRDAISLLDQLRSLPKIDVADVEQRIGKTGTTIVTTLLEAIDARNADSVSSLVREAEDTNVPLDTLTVELLGRLRIRMHADIARNANPLSHIRTIDVLLKAVQDLRFAPVPGLVLEAALLSLCSDTPINQVPVQSIQSKPPAPVATKPAATKIEPPATKAAPVKEAVAVPVEPEVPKAPAAEGAVSLADVRKNWIKIVDKVTPPHVRMSLKNAIVSGIDGNSLTLSFGSAFHRDKVADTSASRAVEEVIKEITGAPLEIICIVEKAPIAPAPTPASNVDLAEAAEDVFGSF